MSAERPRNSLEKSLMHARGLERKEISRRFNRIEELDVRIGTEVTHISSQVRSRVRRITPRGFLTLDDPDPSADISPFEVRLSNTN